MANEKLGWKRALYNAVGVAVLYFFASLAWILFSDAVVAMFAGNAEELRRFQTIKGIAFITTMSLLLGLIVYRLVRSRVDQERAQALMNLDVVTHLPNLHAFTDELCQAVQRKQPFAVVLVDVAGFAGLNATLGRESGDRILSTLADRLHRVLDHEYVVARLQADTFAIITPPRDRLSSAPALAEGLVSALGSDLLVDGRPVQLKLTAGICEYPSHGDSVARLMDAADIALQHTRTPGASRVALYDAAFQAARSENFLLETELRDALRHRQLTVHFQPQFDLASGELSGAEALVRWQHSKHGDIGPDRFIPVAEATGLIDQLSEFVLDEVCKLMHGWIQDGLEVVPVGVNIAGHQLTDLQLGVFVREAAERHQVPFDLLQIEITERLAVLDPERGMELLQTLRDLGVIIALDDFGTGYSSLKYLLELPVDILKIDRSFIADLAVNPQRARFVKAIIDIGRDLDMRIIAEGVETEAQRQLLRNLDCHYAQGYFFSRPVPVDEFRTWLQPSV